MEPLRNRRSIVGDIKNRLHIELSNFLEKSRASAEVVTTDEWDFESSASANSATAADMKFKVLHEPLLIIAYFLPKRKLFLHNVAIER